MEIVEGDDTVGTRALLLASTCANLTVSIHERRLVFAHSCCRVLTAVVRVVLFCWVTTLQCGSALSEGDGRTSTAAPGARRSWLGESCQEPIDERRG